MRAHLWRLNGKVPEPCLDLYRWAMWFETADRRVAKDVLGEDEIMVSTIFLGIDCNYYAGGPPILFETMIFGGEKDESMWRYATWEAAEAGHAKVLALAKEAYAESQEDAEVEASAVIAYVKAKIRK